MNANSRCAALAVTQYSHGWQYFGLYESIDSAKTAIERYYGSYPQYRLAWRDSRGGECIGGFSNFTAEGSRHWVAEIKALDPEKESYLIFVGEYQVQP